MHPPLLREPESGDQRSEPWVSPWLTEEHPDQEIEETVCRPYRRIYKRAHASTRCFFCNEPLWQSRCYQGGFHVCMPCSKAKTTIDRFGTSGGVQKAVKIEWHVNALRCNHAREAFNDILARYGYPPKYELAAHSVTALYRRGCNDPTERFLDDTPYPLTRSGYDQSDRHPYC